MDLLSILLTLQTALAGVSPVAYGLIGLIIVLLKNGTIKLPKLSAPKPGEPESDPSHKSLRERLKDRIDAKFTELVDDEGLDADEVYGELVNSVKDVVPLADDEE
jgi:hypothetical protein